MKHHAVAPGGPPEGHCEKKQRLVPYTTFDDSCYTKGLDVREGNNKRTMAFVPMAPFLLQAPWGQCLGPSTTYDLDYKRHPLNNGRFLIQAINSHVFSIKQVPNCSSRLGAHLHLYIHPHAPFHRVLPPHPIFSIPTLQIGSSRFYLHHTDHLIRETDSNSAAAISSSSPWIPDYTGFFPKTQQV